MKDKKEQINIIKQLVKNGKYFIFNKTGEGKGRKPKALNNLYLIHKYLEEGRKDFKIVNENGESDPDSEKLFMEKTQIKLNELQENKIKDKVKKNNYSQDFDNNIDNNKPVIIIHPEVSNNNTTEDLKYIKPVSFVDEPVIIPPVQTPRPAQQTLQTDNIDLKERFSFPVQKGKNVVTHNIPYPIIFKFNREQEDKYIALYKYMYFNGNKLRHIDWDHCRIMEMIAYRNPAGIQNFDLTASPAYLFAKIWLNDDRGHPKMIFVDDRDQSAYYIYKGSSIDDEVPYLKLTEIEAMRYVRSYTHQLFNNKIPTIVSETEFTKGVLQHIKFAITIPKEKVLLSLPPGVAFKNGFVGHQKGQKLLQFVPFGENNICTSIVPTIPNVSIFEESSKFSFKESLNKMLTDPKLLENNQMMDKSLKSQIENGLKEIEPLQYVREELKDRTFQLTLKVLTESDRIKAMALRSLIQRVIMAKREGRYYQQAFWLSGAPGTTKTTWVDLLKVMAQGSVMELSRSRNQFTAISLIGVKLLIISDVSKLTSDTVEMIRAILGRDTLYGEYKHSNEYVIVRPECQVVFVSNQSWTEFPLIFNRPELRDKITPLVFTESIPQEFMIGNIDEHLQSYCYKFFLWAIFTPRFLLEQQTRAKLLHQLMERTYNTRKPIINEFIEEQIVTKVEGADKIFVWKDELRSKNEMWLTENGLLDDIPNLKNWLKYLPSETTDVLQADYQIKTTQVRTTINKQRGYAIFGIALRTPNCEKEGFIPVRKRKSATFDFRNVDPFYDVDYIEDIEIKEDRFAETQEKILEYRRKGQETK